jgi:hypothetical protein
MPTIDEAISAILILAFFVAIFCGLAAAKHVDSEKKRAMAGKKLETEGEMISEAILNKKGLRWAHRRNWAVIVFAGGGLAYAIVKALLQK